MKLTRMSGAGNSFYIFDEIDHRTEIEVSHRPDFVKKVCNLFRRAPTDGFLFISKHADFNFVWDFYNADGSHAEMCGNAARCATHFFLKNHPFSKSSVSSEVKFLTQAGPIQSRLLADGRIQVQMPMSATDATSIEGYFYINTGVPHIVVEAQPNLDLAKKLRPCPSPKGSNITFIFNVDLKRQSADAITFERGVEGWTRACGTGAVAAAAFLYDKFGQAKSFITMPGGLLEVQYEGRRTAPLLLGPTRFDYSFEVNDIDLK